MKKEVFEDKARAYSDECASLTRVTNIISWSRLAAFFIAVGFFVSAVLTGHIWLYGASAAMLIIFTALVIVHRKKSNVLFKLTASLDICRMYISRYDSSWLDNNDGDKVDIDEMEVERRIKEEYPTARDIDLLGDRSLYRYLCFASTSFGRSILRERLCKPDVNKNAAEIRLRQEASNELSKKDSFVFDFLTLSRQLYPKLNKVSAKDSVMEFDEMCEAAAGGAADINAGGAASIALRGKKLSDYILTALAIALPSLMLISFAVAVITSNTRYAAIGVIIVILQFLMGLLGNIRNGRALAPLYKFSEAVKPYRALLEMIEKEHFTSEYMRNVMRSVNETSGKGGTKASEALKGLTNLSEAVRIRYNPLGYMLCSSLLMWDFHCYDRFNAWLKKYAGSVGAWLRAVGEIEAIISLNTVCVVREHWTFPEICDSDAPILEAAGMRHLLIPEVRAVSNDYKLEHNACVITGSNMSGKTTFLRTIGTNLALAYAGGAVCCDSMRTSVMAIKTSMRLEDSVSEGISTFYAEVLRIKDIVEFAELKIPMIVLIDEIFKGTNSRDRIDGAKAVIRRLARPYSVVFVTTHDYELCALQDDIGAQNAHFTEYYEGDEIKFDYKIKAGRSTTTNARHLLRLAGIMDDE